MKAFQQKTRSPASGTRQRSFLLGLALWLGCLPGVLAQSVPDRLNYQGILLQGDGNPVPAVPTDVEFRIWDQSVKGTLLWGRTHRLTPDTNGAFNVVLMEGGSPITAGSPTYTSLTSVFTGTGSDERYLELTVTGSTAIRPRQRFVAAPYAFLAHDVTAARQDFEVAGLLTVNGAANVGSLTANGAANVESLISSGSAVVGSLSTPGSVSAASFTGSGEGLSGINTNNLVQQVVDALCPPGTIVAYGGVNNPPSGWLFCNGTNVSRTAHARLFNVIGTAYGVGDDSTTFTVPDLRGRMVVGADSSEVLFDTLNNKGGAITHTNTVEEMPTHTHKYRSDGKNIVLLCGEYGWAIDSEDGGGFLPDSPRLSTNEVVHAGGGTPLNIMSPYIVLNYIIKY